MSSPFMKQTQRVRHPRLADVRRVCHPASWSYYERGECGLVEIDTLCEEERPRVSIKSRKHQHPHPL